MGIVSYVPKAIHTDITLSIIVPYFNEQEVLPEFHQRLTNVLADINENSEIVYVNDGSKDNSQILVEGFRCEHCNIKSVTLSRNFGKEAAMSAGLEHSQGKAVILIDADLQDPPELIPQMLAQWQKGFDVVNMQRSERLGESWFKRQSAAVFYKVLNLLSGSDIPENVGDFRLLSRKVVDHINKLPERNRYMKGIFAWPGFKQITLPFQRDARFCGETKWNYFKLIGLAVDGITAFSIKPLRLATLLGFLIFAITFAYSVGVLLFANSTDVFPTMMTVTCFIGSIQLICIGVLGEYVGRIFIETKQRPLYLVMDVKEQHATQQNYKTERFA